MFKNSLLIFSLGLFISGPAISSDRSVPTPVLIEGFEKGLKNYNENDYVDKTYHFSFVENAEEALLEIKRGTLTFFGLHSSYHKNISEFEGISSKMPERGKEPSEPAMGLARVEPTLLRLTKDHSRKAFPEETSALLPQNSPPDAMEYIYWLNFEMKRGYQNIGQQIGQNEDYLSSVLNGSLIIKCKKPDSECELYNLSVDHAGIKWDVTPGGRGRSSEAGGDN